MNCVWNSRLDRRAAAAGLLSRARQLCKQKLLDSMCGHLSHQRGSAREAASAAVEEQVRRRPGVFTERFTEIERERLDGILQAWLAEERQREPFTVLVQEREQSIQLRRIALTARIDRIDRLDDGSVAVIDYKTGLPKLQSWDGERPEDPQLPLYAVAADEAVSGVLFARVRRGKMGFLGLGKRAVAPGVAEVPAPDFDATIDSWRAVLEHLADQVAEGYAAVDPRDGNVCDYCGLHPLCRIAEAGRLPTGEDDA